MARRVDGRASLLGDAMQAGGWRAEDVASASGCSIRTVYLVRRGDVASARLETLVRIANAVGLAVSEMLPGLARRPSRAGCKR